MKLTEVAHSLNSMKNTSILGEVGIDSGISDDATKKGHNSFSELLEKSIQDVNNTQVQAYEAMHDIATGKVENLQEAVQKIQEAELSLKLGLEVKNKALGAYKQIMAMQI